MVSGLVYLSSIWSGSTGWLCNGTPLQGGWSLPLSSESVRLSSGKNGSQVVSDVYGFFESTFHPQYELNKTLHMHVLVSQPGL